jgi:hypothetical protein
MITVQVNCKVCGRPGAVECDPSNPESERLLKLYTCDYCYRARRRRWIQRKSQQPTLPYKDE